MRQIALRRLLEGFTRVAYLLDNRRFSADAVFGIPAHSGQNLFQRRLTHKESLAGYTEITSAPSMPEANPRKTERITVSSETLFSRSRLL